MTSLQKGIKYLAIALAILLTVSIFSGILGAIGTIALLFDEDEASIGEMKTYEISGSITELDIDIAAADFRIIESDKFFVETNNKDISVKESDSKLVIHEKGKKIGATYNSDELVLNLHLPADTDFEKVDIVTGAGVVSINSLSARTLKLELGAGKVDIGELEATVSADIDGGAGQINILGGELRDLDLDMGVGELNLKSKLTGDSDIDCGVGAANITLLGTSDEYRIDIEKGLGDARIDGKSFSGIYGKGSNKIDIDGGIGRIEIKFE